MPYLGDHHQDTAYPCPVANDMQTFHRLNTSTSTDLKTNQGHQTLAIQANQTLQWWTRIMILAGDVN